MDRKQALQRIANLKQRARAGDPKAQAELSALVQRAQAMQAPRPPAEEEDDVFGEDELDVADRMQRLHGHADELAHKVRLRNHKWVGLNDVAPFSRIQPASALHGSLGGQQFIPFPPPGQPVQVANWAGSDDCETLPITVTVWPVQQVPFGRTLPTFRPFSIVQFGTRGFLVRVEVDIGRGCQFTISGSSCTVQVAMEDNSVTAGPYEVPNPGMLLAGMLSFYPVIRTTPVTRTVYIDSTSPIQEFAVPAAAKKFYWIGHSAAVAVDITFFDSGGNATQALALAAGVVQSAPIDLTPDAVGFEVLNHAGGGLQAAGEMLFELAL